MNRDLRETCPSCGSFQVAQISYGFPSDIQALEPHLDSGAVIMGGCDIWPEAPAFHCRVCGHEWGRCAWMQEDPEHRLKNEAARARALEAADQRGTMKARLNKNGYCKCPFCGTSFSTRHHHMWDGVRHKNCLTRIELLPFQSVADDARSE